MKIKFNLIAFFLLLSFVGCKKGNVTTPPNAGDFTFKGIKYSSAKTYLISGGPEKTGYYFDLVLSSSGVNHDAVKDDLVGNGDAIVVGLVSSSETGVAPGTYYFITRFNDYIIWDMSSVSIYLNYNFTDYKGTVYYTGTNKNDNGKMVVSKDGEFYDITYTGTTNGETVEFHYKGTLQVF